MVIPNESKINKDFLRTHTFTSATMVHTTILVGCILLLISTTLYCVIFWMTRRQKRSISRCPINEDAQDIDFEALVKWWKGLAPDGASISVKTCIDFNTAQVAAARLSTGHLIYAPTATPVTHCHDWDQRDLMWEFTLPVHHSWLSLCSPLAWGRGYSSHQDSIYVSPSVPLDSSHLIVVNECVWAWIFNREVSIQDAQ